MKNTLQIQLLKAKHQLFFEGTFDSNMLTVLTKTKLLSKGIAASDDDAVTSVSNSYSVAFLAGHSL